MTQATDTEIRELTNLITALDKKIDLGFADMRNEFTKVEGRLGKIEDKVIALEAKITKLDDRLWTFIGYGITTTLGTLFTILVRYLFWDVKS